MSRPQVLLADDHSPFLQLARVLLDERYDLVGTVRDGLQLMSVARDLKPDVVVTDVTIPYLGGIEAARRLHQLLPDTQVVLLTALDDRASFDAAMRAGASGYLLKRCPPAELCRAIDEVLQGRVYVTPLLAIEESRG